MSIPRNSADSLLTVWEAVRIFYNLQREHIKHYEHENITEPVGIIFYMFSKISLLYTFHLIYRHFTAKCYLNVFKYIYKQYVFFFNYRIIR